MNTCATCKHWAPDVEQNEEWGLCLRITHKSIGAGAFVQAYPDEDPELKTQYLFGCVLHEAKGG